MKTGLNTPQRGSHKLRKGRKTFPQSIYFITTAIHPTAERIDNPLCYEVILETLGNLEHEGVLECFAVVIMPDHVHLIIRLGEKGDLSQTIKRFKGASSIKINRLRGENGSLWYKGFYDRLVRNHEPLAKYINYMYENPVRKGLVEDPGEWPYTEIRWEMTA